MGSKWPELSKSIVNSIVELTKNECSIKAQYIAVGVANMRNCPGGRDGGKEMGLRRRITAASAGILVYRDAEMPHGRITSRDRTAVIQVTDI
jgi:hypothetical protein